MLILLCWITRLNFTLWWYGNYEATEESLQQLFKLYIDLYKIDLLNAFRDLLLHNTF